MTMTTSRRSLLTTSALLLLLLGVSQAQNHNPLGPGALHDLQFFQFDLSARFSCQTTGSRCGFDRSHFLVQPVANGGTFIEQAAGTIWTVNTGADALIISNCKTGANCLVYCFADCTCVDIGNGGSGACATTTAFPTPAPVTAAPAPIVCPLVQNTDACACAMANGLPDVNPQCDCYNFCGGIFKSCCTEATGNCGPTDCAMGEAVVRGCTQAMVSGGGGCSEAPSTSPSSAPVTGAPAPVTGVPTTSPSSAPATGAPSTSPGSVPPPTLASGVVTGVGAAVALAL